jgi:hypothetical protein
VGTGATLIVPSGTVIRATGNVTISGTLQVAANPNAGAGIGTSSPGCDESGAGTQEPGGAGFGNSLIARLLVSPGMIGGGVGGCLGYGGNGGGTVVILASGPITIASSGSIRADGAAAFNPGYGGSPAYDGGGGGGGIVVLASRTSIANSATLSAQGGNGADGDSAGTGGPNGNVNTGAGGGGGGGIISLLAPSITVGTAQYNGGAAGKVGIYSFGYAGGGGGGGIISLLAPSITVGTAQYNGGAAGKVGIYSFGYAGGGGGSYGAGSSAQDVDAGTYPGGTGALFTKITLDPSTLFVPVVHLN